MEFDQLSFFLALVEEGNFSRAAERVGRTQPALSLALKRLEEELGERLLDRTPRKVVPTEAGRLLQNYAHRLLFLREEAQTAIGEMRGLLRGRLRIGANESTSLYLLPELLVAFRQAHPHIKVEVFRSTSEQIPRQVLEYGLDVGFISFDPGTAGVDSDLIHRDPLVLVVPPKHPLSRRKEVRVEELGAETFVAHNARTPARTRLVDFFAAHRTPLNIAVELSTIETIKAFVIRGAGLAILPRMSVADAIASRQLKELRIRDMAIERAIRVVHRPEADLSHAAQAFLGLVRKQGAGGGKGRRPHS
ncbi:MAG TPA: LysR family transcriptional regulator [Holophagaceae bacterium]|nr:LysR family transcriptional regulator [Holophagaceae bacterium]